MKLSALAEALGAELIGAGDNDVQRVATLERAGPGDISFLSNRRYRRLLPATRAGGVLLAAEDAAACPVPALVMANPYLGYARAAALLQPPRERVPGVHASAAIDAAAQVHESARIDAHAVLAAGARVGARAYIGPGCVIGEGAVVGEDCELVARVTLCHDVVLGRRVIAHPGVVIGADGFGIANDDGVWVKIPQLGSVRIGDDVEIGANTTIDRGAIDDTVIEEGVKIDNQVQIGHNVHVGAHTAVAGCVAIAGSAHIGCRCTIGGAASIGGHLEIADDVHLTATSAVANSIKEPGIYSSGMPVQENRVWRRNVIRMRQLDELWRKVRQLEDRLP